MSDVFTKTWYELVINFFKSYLTLTVIVSIFFFWLGLGYFDDSQLKYRDASVHLASTLVAGALLGSIIRSRQFSEIFSEQLRQIVYSKESLANRKDIYSIWKSVSNSLYQSKFPTISNAIHDKISGSYFPTNHDYYQESFEYDISIEYLGNGYIKLIETDTTIIIPSGKNVVIDYNFSTVIDLPQQEHPQHKTFYNLERLEINGQIIEPSVKMSKDNYLTHKFNCPLSGEKRYEVIKRETKIYSIDANPFKRHSLKYFTKKCDINITFPPNDIEIVFCGNGTKEFKDGPLAQRTAGRIKKRCQTLLFPEMGFIIFYQKKVTT